MTDEEAAQLEAENAQLKVLVDRLKMEAQVHAQEARTANATIYEIYQVASGGTGELGNWHGAEPVRKAIGKLKAEVNQLKAELAQVSIERDDVRKLYDAGKAAWDPVYQIVLTERDQLKAELAEARYMRENAESALNTHMEIHARVVNELRTVLEGEGT